MKHPPTPYPTQGCTTNPQPTTNQPIYPKRPIKPQLHPSITNPTTTNSTHPNLQNSQPPLQNPQRTTRSSKTNQPHQYLHTPYKPRTNRLYQRPPPSCSLTPFRLEDESLTDIPLLSIGEPAISLEDQKKVFKREVPYVEDRTGGWVNFWERSEWERILKRREEKRERKGRNGKAKGKGRGRKGVDGRKRGDDGRFV